VLLLKCVWQEIKMDLLAMSLQDVLGLLGNFKNAQLVEVYQAVILV